MSKGCPKLLPQSTVCPDSEHQNVPTEWEAHSDQARTANPVSSDSGNLKKALLWV